MGGTHLALCSLQLGADLLQASVQRSELSFTHAHTVLAAGSRLANTRHSTHVQPWHSKALCAGPLQRQEGRCVAGGLTFSGDAGTLSAPLARRSGCTGPVALGCTAVVSCWAGAFAAGECSAPLLEASRAGCF